MSGTRRRVPRALRKRHSTFAHGCGAYGGVNVAMPAALQFLDVTTRLRRRP
jgi:hypothetical protein